MGRDVAQRGDVGVLVELADVPQPALDVAGEVPGSGAADEDRVEVVRRLRDLASPQERDGPIGKGDRADRGVGLAVVDPLALGVIWPFTISHGNQVSSL